VFFAYICVAFNFEAMKKKLNIDPRYNPVTTIMGVILIFSTLSVEIGSYFVDLKKDSINHWVVGSIGAIGVLLFVSPDKAVNVLVDGFKAIFKKFFGS